MQSHTFSEGACNIAVMFVSTSMVNSPVQMPHAVPIVKTIRRNGYGRSMQSKMRGDYKYTLQYNAVHIHYLVHAMPTLCMPRTML